MDDRTRHRVVVVGGGFCGLAAIEALNGSGFEVTLIDRRNHHLFQPLLYQVATSTLSPSEIAWPITSKTAGFHVSAVFHSRPASLETKMLCVSSKV